MFTRHSTSGPGVLRVQPAVFLPLGEPEELNCGGSWRYTIYTFTDSSSWILADAASRTASPAPGTYPEAGFQRIPRDSPLESYAHARGTGAACPAQPQCVRRAPADGDAGHRVARETLQKWKNTSVVRRFSRNWPTTCAVGSDSFLALGKTEVHGCWRRLRARPEALRLDRTTLWRRHVGDGAFRLAPIAGAAVPPRAVSLEDKPFLPTYRPEAQTTLNWRNS